MATISDVITVMETWAPPEIAESWDNPGLAAGDPDCQVHSLILTLDITEKTLDTAIKKSASLIVSHHPTIFKPLSTLAGNALPLRVIRQAIKHDIALYSAHTNLDQAPNGVSAALAETLGLSDVKPLAPGNCDLVKLVLFVPATHTDRVREAAGTAGAGVIGNYTHCSFSLSGKGTFIPGKESSPYTGEKGALSETAEDRLEMVAPLPLLHDILNAVRAAHPYEEMAYDVYPLLKKEPAFGYGAVGDLENPMHAAIFTQMVAEKLGVTPIAISNGAGNMIRRVAVMGGSGSSHIPQAVRAGADAFVTGEIGHHDFIDHGESILLVDATHYGTELPALTAIEQRLNKDEKTRNIEIVIDRGTLPFSQAGMMKQ